MDIDLDIHNYTVKELFDLLNINDTHNESAIRKVIYETKEQFKSSIDDKDEQEDYVSFFSDVEKKLLRYLVSGGEEEDDSDNETTKTDESYDHNELLMLQNVYNPNKNEISFMERDSNQPNYNLRHQPNVVNSESHNIIFPKTLPIRDTFENRVPNGIMNPIRRRTIKQVISIDSIFRKNYDNTNPSDYVYTFPLPFNNIVSMKLCSLELPNVWYSFSSTKQNNVFYITTENVNGFPNTKHTITIPDGNYTPDEFVAAMNNYFTNTGMGLHFLQLEIDPYTGKTIIRANNINDSTTNPKPSDSTTPATYSPNFTFIVDFRLDGNTNRSLKKNAGWMLGFRKPIYIIDKTITFSSKIINIPSIIYKAYLASEGIYGGNVNHYLFLSVDDFNKNFKNSIISENEESFLGDSILGRISVRVGAQGVVMDDLSDRIFKQRDYFGPINLEKIRIRLLDKFGETIDIQHNDFSFALELEQIYS